MVGLLEDIIDMPGAEIHDFDHSFAIVEHAKFIRNFGLWRKGYIAQLLQIVNNEETTKTMIEELDIDGIKIIQSCEVHLEVKS